MGSTESTGATSARLKTVPLDEASWMPFGWLPIPDTDPRDGEHRLAFAWDDVHVNRIAHTRDEVPATADGLRCEMLFRHDTHTQVLMVLDHPAVLAVAPAEVDFSDPADVERIVAFTLEPQDSLVLHRGTWHWGPFPRQADVVHMFNVQGLRYAEDNAMVDLAARGMAVEVVLP
jgi:hypothetical protein